MTTVTQIIVLKGDQHFGSKPPADAVGEVLRLLPAAIRYSIRMAVEGRSTNRGMRPAWLDVASDVRFVDLDGKDATTLYFELPSLGDAAPKLFEQQEFWASRPDPIDTGFDLLGDVIQDVSTANADSERFDNSLLRRIGKFDHALDGSFQSLDIIARRYSPNAPATISRRVIETAKSFTNTTPQPQAVRVFGRLDMIRASTQSFAVQLIGGEEVRGVADGFEIASLTGMFQKNVVVLGKAVYRPSGRLLRIDASEVRVADEDQKFFSKIPPAKARVDRTTALRPARAKGGVAAIFGKWPGDETDAEIEAALKELS
jgi:hypothetical protein